MDSVPAVLARPCPELQSLAGRPLREVLTDPHTSLTALAAIKEYAKALASRWRKGSEHTVAVLIYYAAIASALCHHGRQITSQAGSDLCHALGVLDLIPGLPESVSSLLSAARSLLGEQK